MSAIFNFFSSLGALTPLYLAGALAVAAPLIFHLIRRTPRGETTFSSLMFLSPSPPRLTRRSRIDNWILLLLRAVALILIALAFMRPFLRERSESTVAGSRGRRLALLVDTSASMQRPGAWENAQREIEQLLADVGPRDQLALFTFGARVSELYSFEEASQMDSAKQVAAIRALVRQASPQATGSNLGAALVQVADSLDVLGDQAESDVDASLQIILISDLQEGAEIDGLQGYNWPTSVRLDARRVEPDSPTNAGLHLLAERDSLDPAERRLRITNAADSDQTQFEVAWISRDREGRSTTSDPLQVFVPPGKSRVVRVPAREDTQATELLLRGDENDYDNVLYVAPIRQQLVDVVYVGTDAPEDSAGMLYYLTRVFTESPYRKVTVRAVAPQAALDPLRTLQAKLCVVTAPVGETQQKALSAFVRQGGQAVCVVTSPEMAETLQQLTQDQWGIEEAPVTDYRLLGQIDFAHPLFAILAKLNFTDFTRTHFWKYRRLTLDASSPSRVLASFDNGDPALVEYAMGDGQLLVMASGWNPDDSQFALSNKFVPLLTMVLERSAGAAQLWSQFTVDESVELPEANPGTQTVVVLPGGGRELIPSGQARLDRLKELGIYRIEAGSKQRSIAVNLPAAESDTTAMDLSALEVRGVRIGKQPTRAEEEERRRQMRDKELESRQRFWQRLLAAALVILVLETSLAGYISRKNMSAAAV